MPTGCTVQELFEYDLHGVEPVEESGLAAGGNAHAVEAFTEAPHSDLVEVMEADGAGQAVEEAGVWYARGYYPAGIELEKVNVAEDMVVRDVSDVDQDEEDQGDEEEEGGEDGKGFSSFRCGFDVCI